MYGPVRTVVWQGSAGDRRPYADYAAGAPAANAAGFESVNQLMADADLQLASNPVTMGGNPNRTVQETIKNALEKANGQSMFVLSSCPAPTS